MGGVGGKRFGKDSGREGGEGGVRERNGMDTNGEGGYEQMRGDAVASACVSGLKCSTLHEEGGEGPEDGYQAVTTTDLCIGDARE